MTEEQAETIIKELEMLRKLRIMELFDKGYSQAQLAQVLGVSQPTIKGLFRCPRSLSFAGLGAVPPHAGQANPSGQRRSDRNSAQLASSAKRRWNSIREA